MPHPRPFLALPLCPVPSSFLSATPNMLSQQHWTDFAGFLAVSVGPRGQGGLIPVCPNTAEHSGFFCFFNLLFSPWYAETWRSLFSPTPPRTPTPTQMQCNSNDTFGRLFLVIWPPEDSEDYYVLGGAGEKGLGSIQHHRTFVRFNLVVEEIKAQVGEVT